ncbi:MAG: methionine gamma-lyase family protein [Ignavibacteriales bacterium]
MNIDPLVIIQRNEELIKEKFADINNISYINQIRVLDCFRENRVSSSHFAPSTGYGYNDLGRETLEAIFAKLFGGEDALVRSQIISGTHALSACLFAVLKKGDTMVSCIGSPYDTLYRVITGTRGLQSRGVNYLEIAPDTNGGVDYNALAQTAALKPALMLVQRSRGYSSVRKSLTISEIDEAVHIIKDISENTVVLVDNCYGEFVETREPGHVKVDLVAGSLIKNPGGGLAAGGGYIAGKAEMIELVADHLVAPGLGKEIGPSLYDLRTVYQGLFLAPHVVGEALKTALLTASVFSELGLTVYPEWQETRSDIVQAVALRSKEELASFVEKVQQCSPVDSHVRPVFGEMPGYDDKIIMAAGTFVQGSSIEISCDAPLRRPYLAFLQGGLAYQHSRYVISELIELVNSWKY